MLRRSPIKQDMSSHILTSSITLQSISNAIPGVRDDQGVGRATGEQRHPCGFVGTEVYAKANRWRSILC